jgi:protein-L-isoaspartate(D-aspartate) O-methyltransferase
MKGNQSEDKFGEIRRQMVKTDLAGRDITDQNVLEVMGKIHREQFVPPNYESQSYTDGPLPIGMGQTISQPYIVALMTQELKLNHNCQVLEVGTGSGYQTAILSKLSKKVYTIERYHQLCESAQTTLARMDIENVEFYIGDGTCGWPGEKKFDRIIVTAAAPTVPQPLIEQLVEGGIMVCPVGGPAAQRLIACKKGSASIKEKFICDVRFVKLVGKFGFDE